MLTATLPPAWHRRAVGRQAGKVKKAFTEVKAFEFSGGASLIRTGDLRIMIPSL